MNHSKFRVQSSKLRCRSQGAALIIVLIFVALLTIMVIGFLDTSRMDYGQASSHMERAHAGLFASEGIQRSLAILQKETVDPPRDLASETPEQYAARTRNWISQPGALVVPDDLPADPKLLRKRIELSSGVPSAQAETDPASAAYPARLNIPLLNQQTSASHLITDRPESTAAGNIPEMKLRWVYVRGDTANHTYLYDFSEQPDTNDVQTPIVGRFAWWVDDESSKINYNLAWKRTPAGSPTPNLNPPSHPSTVNLMALNLPGADGATGYLPEAMANVIRQHTTSLPGRYFNSFADARQIEDEAPGISEFLSANKFELTHYNHDPDTTFFGEERIMLTMNRDLVPKNPDGSYARKFLDILRDDIPVEQLDPGNLDHIAGGQPNWSNNGVLLPNKFDAVVRDLMRYLSTKDWPVAPGQSFKDKYYPGTTDQDSQIAQIAVNILDYVRAKESALPIVGPLRFAKGPSDAAGDNKNKYTLHYDYTSAATGSFQGVCRTPYFTELGYWQEADPAAVPDPVPSGWPRDGSGNPKPLYKGWFRMELYLPERYGLDEGMDLVPDPSPNPEPRVSKGWFVFHSNFRSTSTSLFYHVQPDGNLCLLTGRSDYTPVRVYAEDVSGEDGAKLMPGKRVIITKMYYRDKSRDQVPQVDLRTGLFYGVSDHTTGLLYQAKRVPRTHVVTQHGAITYTLSNPRTTPMQDMLSMETDDPRSCVAAQDWLANKDGKNTFGAINSRSSIGKAPMNVKPQQDTTDGRISDHSLYMPPPKGVGSNGPDGDNGRVVSVAELGYIHTGNNAQTKSIPWRTIRLQPNNYANTETLPDWLLLDLFSVPNTDATGSNQLYKPNGSSVGGRVNVNSHVSPFDTMTRNRSLAALLIGAKGVNSTDQAETIAENIYRRILSPRNAYLDRSFGKIYGYPWTQNPESNQANVFDTPGEICEIAGVADDGEQGEDRVRSIASLITARGGVFSIYTIGQSIRQSRGGELQITAEQRQHAMIERRVSPITHETSFRTVYFRNLSP